VLVAVSGPGRRARRAECPAFIFRMLSVLKRTGM
jgi:hypothetical protein